MLVQARLQAGAHRGDVGEDVLVADHADGLGGDRAPERVARERVAPRKAVGRAHEDVGDMARHGHAGEGQDARGDALGEREDVGAEVPVLRAEPGAGAPEAGDGLVADQQHLVAVAHLAQRSK